MINPLKITLFSSLIGIFILLILMNFSEPEIIPISSITYHNLDKNVKISGQIINTQNFEESEFQIILIEDSTEKIKVTTDKIFNLTKNQTIYVVGKVTEYNSVLQIRADKIGLEESNEAKI